MTPYSSHFDHNNPALNSSIIQIEKPSSQQRMKIAILLPVYNESKCIANTFDEIFLFCQKNPDYHFFFVNDGSTDQTKDILERKINAVTYHPIDIISYPYRQGKGGAIQKAALQLDADYICFMDGDLAYSLEHLKRLISALQIYDMVIGCRNLDRATGGPEDHRANFRNLTLTRKILGKGFNWLTRKILNLRYKDMQAGLKGFRKEVAKELFLRQTITGFSFDAELIYIATKKGYNIGQIPARVAEDHISKNSTVNLIKDSIKMFGCLLKIRYNDLMKYYE
jgi:glycosyltransferase involved in cell wall biosynthesis